MDRWPAGRLPLPTRKPRAGAAGVAPSAPRHPRPGGLRRALRGLRDERGRPRIPVLRRRAGGDQYRRRNVRRAAAEGGIRQPGGCFAPVRRYPDYAVALPWRGPGRPEHAGSGAGAADQSATPAAGIFRQRPEQSAGLVGKLRVPRADPQALQPAAVPPATADGGAGLAAEGWRPLQRARRAVLECPGTRGDGPGFLAQARRQGLRPLLRAACQTLGGTARRLCALPPRPVIPCRWRRPPADSHGGQRRRLRHRRGSAVPG
ncbi:hypothetical protein D3C81_1277460 [compost metagenome]